MNLSLFVLNVLVAPHGISDLWMFPLGDVLLVYSFCTLYIWNQPPTVILVAFLLTSIAHFATDIGCAPAMCFVGYLVRMCLRERADSAVVLLLVYMVIVHLPLHHSRVGTLQNQAYAGVVAAFTCVCYRVNAVAFAAATWSRLRLAAGVVIAHSVLNSGYHALYWSHFSER